MIQTKKRKYNLKFTQMKTKVKIMAFLLFATVFAVHNGAFATVKTKNFSQNWAVSEVGTLEIINKYGDVRVTNNSGSQVTVNVVVTVDAPNERRADELLGTINVNFSKIGNTVKAETNITENLSILRNNNFVNSSKISSINYTINIPSDKNLNISNKFGNTFVNVLNANGNFDIQYGNFKGNELKAPGQNNINFTLAYGKAEIDESNNINFDIKYSNLTMGESQNLEVLSKYSVLKFEKTNLVNIDSRYDTFEFEEIQSVTAVTKFSNLRIRELKKSLKIDAGYGGIKVDNVSQGFESISVENSYGQIRIVLDGHNYLLDASCNYCGISYPTEKFTGDKMQRNTLQTVNGKVGTADGGKVYIRSRYGEIKLQR